MLQLDDDLSLFIDLCASHGACDEALIWLAEQQDDGLTLADMVSLLTEEKSDWALWAWSEIGGLLSSELRYHFLDMATRTNERIAAYYDLNGDLTDAEREMISGRWDIRNFPGVARRMASREEI